MFKPRHDKFSDKRKGGGKFDGKFGNFGKGRDKGFGGGFKGRDRGFGGGGWDREERAVFDAVCDRCGSPCTVPFKPTGSRPVLCKTCFKQESDGGQNRFGKGGDRPSFRRDDRGYGKGGGFNKGGERQPDLKGLERQLQDINRKLDRLLDSLAPSTPKKKDKGGKKKEEAAVIEEVDEDEDDLDVDDDPIDEEDDDDLDDEEDFDDDDLDDDNEDDDLDDEEEEDDKEEE